MQAIGSSKSPHFTSLGLLHQMSKTREIYSVVLQGCKLFCQFYSCKASFTPSVSEGNFSKSRTIPRISCDVFEGGLLDAPGNT